MSKTIFWFSFHTFYSFWWSVKVKKCHVLLKYRCNNNCYKTMFYNFVSCTCFNHSDKVFLILAHRLAYTSFHRWILCSYLKCEVATGPLAICDFAFLSFFAVLLWTSDVLFHSIWCKSNMDPRKFQWTFRKGLFQGNKRKNPPVSPDLT